MSTNNNFKTKNIAKKNNIKITYRELLAESNYTQSTYTINEFLKIIDGTSESFIENGNGRHTYINEYNNEKINETYTFNVIEGNNNLILNREGSVSYWSTDVYQYLVNKVLETSF